MPFPFLRLTRQATTHLSGRMRRNHLRLGCRRVINNHLDCRRRSGNFFFRRRSVFTAFRRNETTLVLTRRGFRVQTTALHIRTGNRRRGVLAASRHKLRPPDACREADCKRNDNWKCLFHLVPSLRPDGADLRRLLLLRPRREAAELAYAAVVDRQELADPLPAVRVGDRELHEPLRRNG